MASISWSLWVQAITADALAVMWLATEPRSLFAFAFLALAGLSTGLLAGWHLSGQQTPCGLWYFWLVTAVVIVTAIVWVLTRPDRKETYGYVADASFFLGFILGHHIRAKSADLQK